MARPYQPSLLRLLHGAAALLAGAAFASGALVYLSDDRRGLGDWASRIHLPSADWIDLHGSAGVVLLPVALLFGAYALTLGRGRLRRFANVLPLAALALAIGSGKLMDEDWLRDGVLDHPVYAVHLLAWAILAASLLVHLWDSLSRGGRPLLQSMLRLELRPGDRPGQWPGQIQRWLQR